MIKRASSIALVLVLCTGCALSLYSDHSLHKSRELNWALQVYRQCEASTSEISDEDCLRLHECVEYRAWIMFLIPNPNPDPDTYSPEFWQISINWIYDNIVPYKKAESFPVYSMSFLRKRAEKMGLSAVNLFSFMEEDRSSCLEETGLTERIGYN